MFPLQGSVIGVQNAVTAIIGRFSQYSGNFIFDQDGSLTAARYTECREFTTKEYDVYAQDSWKISPHLTLN